MTPTVQISRSERLKRIGELLSKGIALKLARGTDTKPNAISTIVGVSKKKSESADNNVSEPRIDDQTEHTIVQYLGRIGSASPRDVQKALNVPKTTAFRKLDNLVRTGLIIRIGQTTAVRYSLAKSSD